MGRVWGAGSGGGEPRRGRHYRWKEEARTRRDGRIWKRVNRPVFCSTGNVPQISFQSPAPRVGGDCSEASCTPSLGSGGRKVCCFFPSAAPRLRWRHGFTETCAVLFHPPPPPSPLYFCCLLATLPYPVGTLAVATSLFATFPDLPPQS